jgi:hypothetical protein
VTRTFARYLDKLPFSTNRLEVPVELQRARRDDRMVDTFRIDDTLSTGPEVTHLAGSSS